MLRNAAQRPENNANPLELSEKVVIAKKVCEFVDKVEILLYKTNHLCVILIEFGYNYFVDTCCGLELGPRS